MPALLVETLAVPANWKVFAPDGSTPSSELALAKDTSRVAPGSVASVRVEASPAALGHMMQCDLVGVDLTIYDELRLSISSERSADGSTAAPFFLEMRLGSASLLPDDPANLWRRLLPISSPRGWELVRFSLADLDASVRSMLTRVQFRCVAGALPFICNLDALIAVRDEMIGDVDRALAALLHERISIGGTAVPAVLHPGNGVLSTARPYFEILNFDVCFSGERTQPTRPRGDFTGVDYSLLPPSYAYELYYQIAAVTDDRASQVKMLELALRTLRPRGDLLVNGYALPMEMVAIPPRERIGGSRTDEIPLYFKISTRMETGAREAVRAARKVVIDGDLALRT